MQTDRKSSTACRRIASPAGILLVSMRGGAITQLTWCHEDTRDVPADNAADNAVLDQAAAQLAAYFAGTLQRFDVPVAPAGSAFERSVWTVMSAIPFGRTRTYGELAHELGGVAQAVGQACGANPIPIIIPCHRVVASGGRLGGFSGGQGIASKRALLAHEHAVPNDGDLFARPVQTATSAPGGR